MQRREHEECEPDGTAARVRRSSGPMESDCRIETEFVRRAWRVPCIVSSQQCPASRLAIADRS
jgi:hypothetical protein